VRIPACNVLGVWGSAWVVDYDDDEETEDEVGGMVCRFQRAMCWGCVVLSLGCDL
jgi:hypothetical protein